MASSPRQILKPYQMSGALSHSKTVKRFLLLPLASRKLFKTARTRRRINLNLIQRKVFKKNNERLRKDGEFLIVMEQLTAGSRDSKDLMLPVSSKLKYWQWWLLVVLNILFLLAGQTAATLLGNFYYDQGGNSKWLSTLIQTALFPILFIPFIFLPTTSSSSSSSVDTSSGPSIAKLAIIYTALGLIIAADNLMYSYGLLYLPVSTYSLICASQLAFNAIFAYFLNSQKFTPLILNSVILLSFSSALLGVDEDSSGDPADITRGKFILGFILTVGASATYSLILSLMQLTFQKVIKKETFVVVLEMQIYTALVASCASVIGLFASGEWKGLPEEYEGFFKGKASYVMTVVGVGVAWQVASVGVVGLIFLVSSLFSNAISTLALPIIPVFAVIFFHDTMNGVKVMAMLIAIWGFISYLYQNYIDDLAARKAVRDTTEISDASIP
ncbi:putative purine permease 11 [Dendrobium catenatum]|uniref:Probable purine permease n=2 Tax=Dendrobium catenatum TaxID=906689 RepID=A0A2I0WKK5_9ASPA|nr:putative purine permease 11 [Dendrobium catenatum]